jgi:hypothetical protein
MLARAISRKLCGNMCMPVEENFKGKRLENFPFAFHRRRCVAPSVRINDPGVCFAPANCGNLIRSKGQKGPYSFGAAVAKAVH